MDFKRVEIVNWKDDIEVLYELEYKNHSTRFSSASSSISFLAAPPKYYLMRLLPSRKPRKKP